VKEKQFSIVQSQIGEKLLQHLPQSEARAEKLFENYIGKVLLNQLFHSFHSAASRYAAAVCASRKTKGIQTARINFHCFSFEVEMLLPEEGKCFFFRPQMDL